MNDFHKSFIKSMVLCGIVTLVSMYFSRLIVEHYMGASINTPSFTSQKSQYSTP
jgi:hypothetical protein